MPALFFALLSTSLVGCDLLDLLKPGMRMGKSHVDTAALPQGIDVMSPREKLGFYRWLVGEMQEQIFARPLKDRSSSDGWANVLAQRGSIEGVYHGFVLSTEYITMEQKQKAADIKALRFFGLEMALMDFPYATESDERVQSASAKYVKENMSTSVFTLKKQLGERIIKEADKRKADGEKLAAWFSGIAVRWAKLDIPFGLKQRNDKDEVFHFNWAKENTLGMVEWELLNREHRILNQLSGIAVAEPSRAGK
ncbi:MAG: hypothetical protein ACXWSD_11400 [Bdellovibrionota bacterium]